MTSPNAGSASVSIVPDLRGFAEKLSSALLPQARAVGDEVGREIGQGISDQVDQSLDRVRAKLDELGLKRVDVSVNVDDHGSAAETAAKVGAVGAAGSGSTGGISALTAGILAFGPAAVGAAAVAIPAIIAIGAAAAGAFAGLGVLALGFSGIGDALSAANKPKAPGSGGGAGSSAGLAAQSQQLAAKQATQSASDQLTQAIQRESDAETTLTKAQRDSTDAQKALTLARAQAQQDLQDLANKVTDNGLAQRDAAIKLAQAKAVLDATNAAPGAGLAQYKTQVAQAQLDYDKAKQNASELSLTGTRLAAQQKTATQQGVSGSAGVVAAQNKVTDSSVALSKAQRDVTDAAHKLSEAQQNVADTQTKNAIASQQAAIGLAGAAGGANSYAAAMAKLNPLQQEFVRYLLSLKPLLDELKGAAAEFLPGLQQGIQSALPAFGPLLDLVKNVAKALGGVFTDIGKAIGSGDGQKFIQFLATELPNQIRFLGRVALDFAKIFGGVFEQFAPLIKVIDTAVLGFLDNLAKASTTGGFAGFIKEIAPLIPKVFGTLATIGDLVGKVFLALGPAIGPSLDLLKLLATQLGKIAGPVLTPLARAFGDIVKAISPMLPLMASIITAVLPPLIRLLDVAVNQGIAPLAQAIANTLTPYLPVLSKAFNDLVSALAPLIPAIAQGLVKGIAAVAPLLPGLVKSFSDLVAVFVKLLPQLIPIIPPLIQLVVTVFTSQNITILTLFVAVLAKVLGALLPVIGKMADFTTAILNAGNSAAGFAVNIETGLNGAISGVSNFFSALPGRIRGFIGDAGSWLVDVGTSIIDGLAKGIGDAIGSLGGVLGHVADFIPGWLKKILHINSPSKLLADEIGQWIPAGIAEGILGNLDVVPKALNNVLASVTKFSANPVNLNTSAVRVGAQQAGAALSSTVGAVGGFSQTNNFSVVGAADPQLLTHAVTNRQAMRAS